MTDTSSTANTAKQATMAFIISIVIMGPIFFLSAGTGAQTSSSSTTSMTSVSSLNSSPNSQNTSRNSGSFLNLLFGSATRTYDPIITIVQVEGQKEIYRIIDGKKHLLPTDEIFFSYGFDPAIIQSISLEELNRYPIARLLMLAVTGTEQKSDINRIIYYISEGGRIRPILNEKVFYSYGNRMEDVVTANQKELNYYPRTQFIRLERPSAYTEIYQITGGVKRYLTPIAVERMKIKEYEIAPVNQIEFDAYPNGEAIIF